MKSSFFSAFGRICFAVAFFSLVTFSAQAQTFLGTAGDGLWSNVGNWLDELKPDGMFSEVTISADVVVDEDVSIGTLNNAGRFSLTVLPNKTLTVNVAINWGDNDFVLEDKAKLVYSGNVRVLVKKHISAYDENSHLWDLIASPVQEDIWPSLDNGFLTDPETGYLLFSYNENIADWINFKETPFALENGKSYLYANALDTTLLFVGTTVGYTAECHLSYHAENGAYAGCNFVGNPLPCNAYLNRSYYVMNEEGSSLLPVPNSTTSSVAPCSGIVVNAESVDDTSFWFSHIPYFQFLSYQGYIEATVAKSNAPSSVLDQALLSYNSGDDLGELTIFPEQPSLCFSMENKNYSILSVDSVDVQPLKFKAAENGSYVLHVEPNGRMVAYMHLIDNITGQNVDLLTHPDYTFTASTNDYASRFKLVFKPGYGLEEFENQNFAYYSDGMIYINDVETCHGASLQMVDLTGRVILCSDDVHTVSTQGMAPGIYLLRLKTQNGMLTQKIVIQ